MTAPAAGSRVGGTNLGRSYAVLRDADLHRGSGQEASFNRLGCEDRAMMPWRKTQLTTRRK